MSLPLNDSWSCPRCAKHLDGLMLVDRQDRRTAAHALEVAANCFDEDAKTAREANQIRVAEQFEKQARESRELAERFE